MDPYSFFLESQGALGKGAQGPGIGAKGADAGEGVGGRAPPTKYPIMGTLRALGPKGPK